MCVVFIKDTCINMERRSDVTDIVSMPTVLPAEEIIVFNLNISINSFLCLFEPENVLYYLISF